MQPTAPYTQPSFPKVAVSFGIGVVLGLTIGLPVIRDDLATISLGDLGAVGHTLLIGVFSVAIVTIGLFGLYQLFWLVDR